MIRHPNNSGLLMDQITRLYIPSFFVHSSKVSQDNELLLAMEGSISISEDPNVRFTYVPDNSSSLRAEAIDTADHMFTGSWPASGTEAAE
jgi:sulfur-oxidizing protein SoxY